MQGRGSRERAGAKCSDALGDSVCRRRHLRFHRFDLGSEAFELGSKPPRKCVKFGIRGGKVRAGFVELNPEGRFDAVHFCGELVDAGIQLPKLNAEYRKAGEHHDEYGDDDEAEAAVGHFQPLLAVKRRREIGFAEEDRSLCHPLGAPQVQTVASEDQGGTRLV